MNQINNKVYLLIKRNKKIKNYKITQNSSSDWIKNAIKLMIKLSLKC